VIAALRELGLWRSDASPTRRYLDRLRRAKNRKNAPPTGNRDRGREPADLPRDPLKSWRNSYVVFHGTWTAIYLLRRGLILTDAEITQFHTHPRLWHWPTQTKWPAMLALVRKWTDSGFTDTTVAQTFLAHDGSSKAPIITPRLFPAGVNPVGAGVWFGEPDREREFVVAEGVESLLSALRLIGAVDGCAALSALGIRELILPAAARQVCVFADNDENKQSFAAARAAYRRWRNEGRDVRVMLPDRVGADANDLLRQRLGL
jgi:hypothetical protein